MKRDRQTHDEEPLGTTELIAVWQGSSARRALHHLQRFTKTVASQRRIALQLDGDESKVEDDYDVDILDDDVEDNKRLKKDEAWKADTADYNVPFVGTSVARGSTGHVVIGKWPTGLLKAYLTESPLANELLGTDAFIPPNGRFQQEFIKQRNHKASKLLYKVYLRVLSDLVSAAMTADRVKEVISSSTWPLQSLVNATALCGYKSITPPLIKLLLSKHLRHICNAIQSETAGNRGKNDVVIDPVVSVALRLLYRLVHVSTSASFQVVKNFGNSGAWRILLTKPNVPTDLKIAASDTAKHLNQHLQARTLAFQLIIFWVAKYKDDTVLDLISSQRTKDRAPGALFVCIDIDSTPDIEIASLLRALTQQLSTTWRRFYCKQVVQKITKLVLQYSPSASEDSFTFSQYIQQIENDEYTKFPSCGKSEAVGAYAFLLLYKLLTDHKISPLLQSYCNGYVPARELLGDTLNKLFWDTNSVNSFKLVLHCLTIHHTLWIPLFRVLPIPDKKVFPFLYVANRLAKLNLSGPNPDQCVNLQDVRNDTKDTKSVEILMLTILPMQMTKEILNKSLSRPDLVICETLKFLILTVRRYKSLQLACMNADIDQQFIQELQECFIQRLPDSSTLLKIIAKLIQAKASQYANTCYSLIFEILSTCPEYFGNVAYDWMKHAVVSATDFCILPILVQQQHLRLLSTLYKNNMIFHVQQKLALFRFLIDIMLHCKILCIYTCTRKLILNVFIELVSHANNNQSGAYLNAKTECTWWLDGLLIEQVDTFVTLVEKASRFPLHSAVTIEKFSQNRGISGLTITNLLSVCLEDVPKLDSAFLRYVSQVIVATFPVQSCNDLLATFIVEKTNAFNQLSQLTKYYQKTSEISSDVSSLFSNHGILVQLMSAVEYKSTVARHSILLHDDYSILGRLMRNNTKSNILQAPNVNSTFIAVQNSLSTLSINYGVSEIDTTWAVSSLIKRMSQSTTIVAFLQDTDGNRILTDTLVDRLASTSQLLPSQVAVPLLVYCSEFVSLSTLVKLAMQYVMSNRELHVKNDMIDMFLLAAFERLHKTDAILSSLSEDNITSILGLWVLQTSGKEADHNKTRAYIIAVEKLQCRLFDTSRMARIVYLHKVLAEPDQVVDCVLESIYSRNNSTFDVETGWLYNLISLDVTKMLPILLDKVSNEGGPRLKLVLLALSAKPLTWPYIPKTMGKLLEVAYRLLSTTYQARNLFEDTHVLFSSNINLNASDKDLDLIMSAYYKELCSDLKDNYQWIGNMSCLAYKSLVDLCETKVAVTTMLPIVVFLASCRFCSDYLTDNDSLFEDGERSSMTTSDKVVHVLKGIAKLSYLKYTETNKDDQIYLNNDSMNAYNTNCLISISMCVEDSGSISLECFRTLSSILRSLQEEDSIGKQIFQLSPSLSNRIVRSLLNQVKLSPTSSLCKALYKEEMFRCILVLLQKLDQDSIDSGLFQELKLHYFGYSNQSNKVLKECLEICAGTTGGQAYSDDCCFIKPGFKKQESESSSSPWEWLGQYIDDAVMRNTIANCLEQNCDSSYPNSHDHEESHDQKKSYDVDVMLSMIVSALDWVYGNLSMPSTGQNDDMLDNDEESNSASSVSNIMTTNENDRQNVFDVLSIFHQLTRKHCLELAIKALAFAEKNRRLLALSAISISMSIISRKEAKQDKRWKSRPQEKMLLMSIRNGLLLNGYGRESQALPHLSSFAATFLSKAYAILMDPNHLLYSSINRYFLKSLKTNGAFLDVHRVPAFSQFYQTHSNDFELAQYERSWMLTIIESSIHSSKCCRILISNHITSALLSHFSSTPRANTNECVMILRIFLHILKYAEVQDIELLMHDVGLLAFVDVTSTYKEVLTNSVLCKQFWSLVSITITKVSENLVKTDGVMMIVCRLCWHLSTFCLRQMTSDVNGKNMASEGAATDTLLAAIKCLDALTEYACKAQYQEPVGISGLNVELLIIAASSKLELCYTKIVFLAYCYLPWSIQELDNDNSDVLTDAFLSFVSLADKYIDTIQDHTVAILSQITKLSKHVRRLTLKDVYTVPNWYCYCLGSTSTRILWFRCLYALRGLCDGVTSDTYIFSLPQCCDTKEE